MSTLTQDLRFAIRNLARTPAFTGIAVATLALGIGLNTAVFSVVDAALFRPLAYDRPQELLRVWDSNPSKGFPRFFSSPPNFVDWREQNRTLAGMAAFCDNDATLLEGSEPERIGAYQVSPSLFPLLGVRPLYGRTFERDDEKTGRPPTVVLSWQLWQRRFGGDPGVVGRAIRLDQERPLVIGVMPRGFRFPTRSSDVWLPLVLDAHALENRGAHWIGVIARRKAGVALGLAQADLSAIAARLAAAYPAKDAGWGVELVPLAAAIAGEARRPLLLLLGSVAFVLVIACANVANLLLARGFARRRELAIRTALGAGRWRLVRQLLAESLLLTLAGGAAGTALALWGSEALIALGGTSLPRAAEAGVDGRALLFTLVVSVASAIAAGLWPALRAAADPDREALRESAGRASPGRRASSARRALLAAEVAVTLLLLAGAALLLRSMTAALRVDPGFRPNGVLTAQISLPARRYEGDDRTAAFSRELQSRLGRLPGVTGVATTNVLPMAGGLWEIYSVQLPGQPESEIDEISLAYRVVGGDFFRVTGIPLRRGRVFGPEDGPDSQPVAILSETAARRRFPGQDPIGRQIVIGDRRKTPRLIVGVVGDVREESPIEPPTGDVYISAEQRPRPDLAVLLGTAGDPAALASALRQEVRALDPELPVEEVAPLSEQVAQSLKPRRFTLTLLAAFSILALLLSAVGTYGVASCAATERTREIGIRVAMGARRADVLSLFLGEAVRVGAIGLGAGLLLAAPATRLLRGLLFGVSPFDPASFAGVCLLLLSAVLFATLAPALRATRIDPIAALRSE